MPYYSGLKVRAGDSAPTRQWKQRAVERIRQLRQNLARNFATAPPASPRSAGAIDRLKTLRLATWNIREFDSSKYGWRLPESYYYLAEIISHFDVVAVQEVREDLSPLKALLSRLGREWTFIATDVTDGASGNGERMVFLYNTARVWFRQIAGEIVLPRKDLIGAAGEQFARSPFIVALQAGWFKFMLCTVHIYYGDEQEGSAELKRRIDEIAAIAKVLGQRAKSEQARAESQEAVAGRSGPALTASHGISERNQFILLGDFNIKSPQHQTMQALLAQGFFVPPGLTPTNIGAEEKYYDQIAFYGKADQPVYKQNGIPLMRLLRANVFSFFDTVFTDADEAVYVPEMGEDYRQTKAGRPRKNPQQYYRDWRTHQMSDHKLLWVELQTDFTDEYLDHLTQAPG